MLKAKPQNTRPPGSGQGPGFNVERVDKNARGDAKIFKCVKLGGEAKRNAFE